MAGEWVFIIQQVECEGPGFFHELLAKWSVPSRTVHLYRGESTPDLSECRALLVLGGSMSVYDEEDFPFLTAEHALIRAALRKHIPYLGICLGGQLLAKALRARVKPNPLKEVGFYEVHLTHQGRQDALFQGLGDRLRVFQWHGDTFDIPRGATLLATAPTCLNQAFRYGNSAYALQFHVETTPEMVRDWVNTYRDELETEGIDTTVVAPPDLEERCDHLRQEAERILSNFLHLAE
ncbi:MAG: type 1 glutamine amidotransferase [Chloroflexota bacterium]